MSPAAAPRWLGPVYAVALFLHATFFAIGIGLAIVSVAMVESTANAARGGAWLATAIMSVTLSPAIPSAFALVSWWICKKRGWTPTPGHQGLVVAAAALILILMIAVLVS